MKNALGMNHDEMTSVSAYFYWSKLFGAMLCLQVFKEWNKGELDSFLIEITADIMAFRDTDGTPLVEKIRDSAGQKGTGKWTAISALDKGMPVTLIGR